MKYSDIFMMMLVLNALRDIDIYSYIIFGCAIVCLICRLLQHRGIEQ